MKCFFIQKTSPSLGTFSCEQANVVWVSCEFQKYVTTLWKRCASLNILQLLSPPRRPLWFSFTFLLEYPAEANLQRREVQLCLCRDMKLNTPDAWTNSLVFNYKNHIKIHGWIIHFFRFILLGLEAKYEFWIRNCRKCSIVKWKRVS